VPDACCVIEGTRLGGPLGWSPAEQEPEQAARSALTARSGRDATGKCVGERGIIGDEIGGPVGEKTREGYFHAVETG
jgi:hypothetical protein